MNVLRPIRLPEWHEGDGPVALVFSRYPLGDRCAWGCVWSYSGGLATPDDTLRAPSTAQIVAEFEDALAHPWQWAHHQKIRDELAHISAHRGVSPSGTELLRQVRAGAHEYIADWDPPEKVIQDRGRPGWRAPKY